MNRSSGRGEPVVRHGPASAVHYLLCSRAPPETAIRSLTRDWLLEPLKHNALVGHCAVTHEPAPSAWWTGRSMGPPVGHGESSRAAPGPAAGPTDRVSARSASDGGAAPYPPKRAPERGPLGPALAVGPARPPPPARRCALSPAFRMAARGLRSESRALRSRTPRSSTRRSQHVCPGR